MQNVTAHPHRSGTRHKLSVSAMASTLDSCLLFCVSSTWRGDQQNLVITLNAYTEWVYATF